MNLENILAFISFIFKSFFRTVFKVLGLGFRHRKIVVPLVVWGMLIGGLIWGWFDFKTRVLDSAKGEVITQTTKTVKTVKNGVDTSLETVKDGFKELKKGQERSQNGEVPSWLKEAKELRDSGRQSKQTRKDRTIHEHEGRQ